MMKITDWIILVLPLTPAIMMFTVLVIRGISEHRYIDRMSMWEKQVMGYVTTGLDQKGNITYRKRY